jgi:thymidylate synthase
MKIKPLYIEAVDLPDAWFQCVYNLFEHGNKYTVQQGSWVGETRLEYPFITILIKKPYSEPYDSMLPVIPEGLNIPNPVEPGYIEQYMPYLMTSEIDKNEQYTYGSRLNNYIEGYKYKGSKNDILQVYSKGQIEHFVRVLKETPNTNQAVLQVAQPSDCLLNDPPCLRHIDLKVRDNKLNFYPYFRSWDLWGGFPANLAGIAVLQKYMADEIGIQPGFILASSKGLHIYEYAEELAKIRINKCK